MYRIPASFYGNGMSYSVCPLLSVYRNRSIVLSFRIDKMKRSYGALSLLNARPLDIFTPDVRRAKPLREISMIQNLPAVKDQGEMPVCTAVAALTMYEQLLLRENLHGYSKTHRGELGWAWIYLGGINMIEQDNAATVHEQLLTGLPFVTALQALIARGVVTSSPDLFINDPAKLAKQLQSLDYTPWGRLAVPLRMLAVLPTIEALYDVIQAQYAIGFVFAIDSTIDHWMHNKELQVATEYELPHPSDGSPRLATHAAIVTAIDLNLRRATIQNSFGSQFGTMGFFFVSLPLLLKPQFSNLEYYVLVRAG